jgi:hypothetical protein
LWGLRSHDHIRHKCLMYLMFLGVDVFCGRGGRGMARDALKGENIDIFPHFSEEGMTQGVWAGIHVEIVLPLHVPLLTSQCLNAKRLTRIGQGSEHELAS